MPKVSTTKVSTKRSKKAVTDTKAKKIDDEKRREMIAYEAYLCAEQRGFHGGDPVQDWLLAENQVDQIIKQMSKKTA